jgi:hypothetical protein
MLLAVAGGAAVAAALWWIAEIVRARHDRRTAALETEITPITEGFRVEPAPAPPEPVAEASPPPAPVRPPRDEPVAAENPAPEHIVVEAVQDLIRTLVDTSAAETAAATTSPSLDVSELAVHVAALSEAVDRLTGRLDTALTPAVVETAAGTEPEPPAPAVEPRTTTWRPVPQRATMTFRPQADDDELFSWPSDADLAAFRRENQIRDDES